MISRAGRSVTLKRRDNDINQVEAAIKVWSTVCAAEEDPVRNSRRNHDASSTSMCCRHERVIEECQFRRVHSLEFVDEAKTVCRRGVVVYLLAKLLAVKLVGSLSRNLCGL